MQSFLGFANSYCQFNPVASQTGGTFAFHHWSECHLRVRGGSEQEQAFNESKKSLIEATALAQPDSDGEFVLDTTDSAVEISVF